MLQSFDRWMAERPLAYGALLLGLVTLLLMLYVDQLAAIVLHRSSVQLAQRAWHYLAGLGDAVGWVTGALVVYAGSVAAARRGVARAPALRLARHCLLLLASLVTVALVVHLLKALVARLRPRLLLAEGEYGFLTPFSDLAASSFPSGHTAIAFVAAAVLARLAPAYRAPLFFLAGLVACARVASGAHFPSDVVVAAAVGLAVVRLLAPRFLATDRVPWPSRVWRQAAPPASTRP